MAWADGSSGAGLGWGSAGTHQGRGAVLVQSAAVRREPAAVKVKLGMMSRALKNAVVPRCGAGMAAVC